MLLEVPLFRQEEEWSCLAACVRMCMAGTGDHRSEAEWSQIIGTGRSGATIRGTVEALRLLRLDVDVIRCADPEAVQAAIGVSRPVIVGTLQAQAGGRWTQHAVVVVGATEGEVTINDPAVGNRV